MSSTKIYSCTASIGNAKNKQTGKASRISTILRLAESWPSRAIVQAINSMLEILRKRGVIIVDFEDSDRAIYGFKIFTNTAYLLATKPKEEEHGEHQHE